MYPYSLSLLFAGYAIAISLENVPQVYNVGRSTINLHGSGYVSTLALWQSSSNGLKTLIEKIIPPAPCDKNELCSLYPTNDSLIFDITRYQNGNNYLFSLDWSQEQLAQNIAIHTVWSPHFSINYEEAPMEVLELRDEEPEATETTVELSTTSANSTAVMATGQTFAAIDPIRIDVVLYEIAEDSVNSTSTNSTAIGEVTAAVAIATQSLNGLLRSPISVNTSGVLTVSTTSQMGLATLATAMATATASNATATAKAVAVDGIGVAAMKNPNSLVSVGIVVAFGLLHLWL